MTNYSFTLDAADDLDKIWGYTYKNWGMDQADSYIEQLHKCCQNIAVGDAFTRQIVGLSDVKTHHCHHHYLFFKNINNSFIIIAIFHENMDLLLRLKDRLE